MTVITPASAAAGESDLLEGRGGGARPLGFRSRRRGGGSTTLWFALPALIWFVVFTIGPLVAMFFISTLRWRTILAPSTFAGAENFTRLVADPMFWQSTLNTLIHLIGTVPVMMFIAFMIGYYLNQRPRGHRFLRVILFIPALISLSALGVMFLAILGPDGMVNSVLEQVGLGQFVTAWLGDARTALISIVVVNLWASTGFNAVLFAARMAAVPEEIFQAAEIDGASHWRRMWSITYPIIKDYFGVLTMLQFLGVFFGSAGLVLLLTGGGPGNASATLSWKVYQYAFLLNDLGYSQAVGVVMFFLGIIGLLLIRRVFRPSY